MQVLYNNILIYFYFSNHVKIIHSSSELPDVPIYNQILQDFSTAFFIMESKAE